MNKTTEEQAVQALAQALFDCLKLLGSSQKETMPAPRLYTHADLAEMLGKSKDTIRQWVCAGEFGEPVKVGNSTRVTQAGVDKYIADHTGPTEKRPSRARIRTARPIKVNPSGQPLGI